jgi:hypothetical protein
MKAKVQVLFYALLASATSFAAKLPSEGYKAPGDLPGDPGEGGAPVGDGFWVLAVLIAFYVGYRVYRIIKARQAAQ